MDSCDNHLLLLLRDLLALKLTPHGDAQDFYNDCKMVINRLEELNSNIISEKPFIREILLSAIPDKNYDVVQNYITKHPTKGANDILEAICQCTTMLSSFETGDSAQVAMRSKISFGKMKSSSSNEQA